MECFITDEQEAFRQVPAQVRRDERAEFGLTVCEPGHLRQRIAGFGGAFTEAGAYVFAQMPPAVQDEFLLRCFGAADRRNPAAGGNAYSLCRTHIQSCDFALGNYAYVTDPRDRSLSTFSLDRDRQLLIPFIRCGLAVNPALELVASPWSPPAFMKTNLSMNRGGRLRRRYFGRWAALLARYVDAYAREGIRIGRMTVQNEPMARQTWDSCLFTGQQEAEFAAEHLRPALDAAGYGDVRLLGWDHNTDRLVERADALLAARDGGAPAAFDGIAFHWYTGDHFEAVRAVAQAHPGKELLFTEGCVEYSRNDGATETRKAEQYAHAAIGHLDAGAAGFIDWNLLLDERGGPNHVRNFCEAPLMYDRGARQLIVHRSFYYLGHLSRFVAPGARSMLVSRCDDAVECAGFVNPDGSRALVALNRRDHGAHLSVAERPYVADVDLPPHAIATLTWDRP